LSPQKVPDTDFRVDVNGLGELWGTVKVFLDFSPSIPEVFTLTEFEVVVQPQNKNIPKKNKTVLFILYL
jgi:hypothetical protein